MVVSHIFDFHPTWGRFPFRLRFFQMGWFNHQTSQLSVEESNSGFPLIREPGPNRKSKSTILLNGFSVF